MEKTQRYSGSIVKVDPESKTNKTYYTDVCAAADVNKLEIYTNYLEETLVYIDNLLFSAMNTTPVNPEALNSIKEVIKETLQETNQKT